MKDKNFKKRYRVPKTAAKTAVFIQKLPDDMQGFRGARINFWGDKLQKFSLVLSFEDDQTVYLEPEQEFQIRFKTLPFGAAIAPVFIEHREVK